MDGSGGIYAAAATGSMRRRGLPWASHPRAGRRRAARRGLLCLLLGFAVASSPAAEAPATVPMPALQVGEHTWYVQGENGAVSAQNQGFTSNAGFVVTDEGVLVVDALGTRPLARKLLEAIRGVTDKPVKIVVVTRYQADHTYGLQIFEEAGARIWAHERGQDVLRSGSAQERLARRRKTLAPWIGADFRILPAYVWLAGDTDFTFGGLHFLLRYAGPVHPDGDMALLVVEDGVLFAGDLVSPNRIPCVGDADTRAWLAALDKLAVFRPPVLVGGHGRPADPPEQELKFTADYLRYLRTHMGKAAAEFTPFDAAYAGTDWTEFETMPGFADFNRSNAYNVYLQREREAQEKK